MKSADYWEGYRAAIEKVNSLLPPDVMNPVLDEVDAYLAEEMRKIAEQVKEYITEISEGEQNGIK